LELKPLQEFEVENAARNLLGDTGATSRLFPELVLIVPSLCIRTKHLVIPGRTISLFPGVAFVVNWNAVGVPGVTLQTLTMGSASEMSETSVGLSQGFTSGDPAD
jgi:hypothetical protein